MTFGSFWRSETTQSSRTIASRRHAVRRRRRSRRSRSGTLRRPFAASTVQVGVHHAGSSVQARRASEPRRPLARSLIRATVCVRDVPAHHRRGTRVRPSGRPLPARGRCDARCAARWSAPSYSPATPASGSSRSGVPMCRPDLSKIGRLHSGRGTRVEHPHQAHAGLPGRPAVLVGEHETRPGTAVCPSSRSGRACRERSPRATPGRSTQPCRVRRSPHACHRRTASRSTQTAPTT